MVFELRDVVPWGRSYAEYVAMFGLTAADLERKILGCGDGPAAFNAALTRRGGRCVSCDPIYRFSTAEIESRIDETAATIGAELTRNLDEFVWDHFESADDVIETRMRAMAEFLSDLPAGRQSGRYVEASLPLLPFADDEFDLALCSHFLFLYAGQHDLDFHVASTLELCRVAREVRIFPLVELGSVPSRHRDAVENELEARELAWTVTRVPYEFQRGGNEMLVIRRAGDAPGA